MTFPIICFAGGLLIGGVFGVLVISLCRVSGRAALEEEVITLRDAVKMYEIKCGDITYEMGR